MSRNMTAARAKVLDEAYCRVCHTWANLDPHHVVYKSLGGDDDPDNIVPICRTCHDHVHRHELNLLPHLTMAEQLHAVSLIGLGRAYGLLMPSESHRRVA